MALVIEDGDGGDPTANSYATLVEIRAYNTARGRTLDAVDGTVEAQAILAMDYIEFQEPNMQGYRTFGSVQPLSFPRENIIIGGDYLPNDEIPVALKNAQAEMTWQIDQGVIPFKTITTAGLKRRKTGPLEKEWFEGEPSQPSIPYVDRWLEPFLISIGFDLRVERV
jgi:hypothetical protein